MTASANRSVASIKARLLNVSKAAGEEFQLTLERYAVERFLVRVVSSRHQQQFVLKGATLYPFWTGETYRPTRDLDLLGELTPDERVVSAAIREICETAVEPDGLEFDANAIEASKIREEQRYGGIRVLLNAYLGKARIRVQVDVGFGDVVTPGPRVVQLTSLLSDIPAAAINAYNLETVIAEKIEAMVSLGMTNSRMKDFYDIWTFARRLEFDGRTLVGAITNTFNRRATPIPLEVPVALTSEFAESTSASNYWIGFLRAAGLEHDPPSFVEMTAEIGLFALPLLSASRTGSDFSQHWPPGGPWSVARSSASSI